MNDNTLPERKDKSDASSEPKQLKKKAIIYLRRAGFEGFLAIPAYTLP
jgi:hypothetical protein